MCRKLILFFFLAGCNSDSKDSVSPVTDTAATQSIEVTSGNFDHRQISSNEIPEAISFKGRFVAAFTWNDKAGKSIVIFSSVPTYPSPMPEMNDDEISSELHVTRYVIRGNDTERNWKWEGGILNCPFDIVSEFIKDAITITDLDKDGIAELCFQAIETCRSDVSPASKRLVMIEDGQMYTLKGMMWLPLTPGQVLEVNENNVNLEKQQKPKDESEEISMREGRYESEKEFAKAPPVFLQYARSQWLKFIKESFD